MNKLSGSRKIYAFGSLVLGVLLLLWPGDALRLAAYVVGMVVMAGGVISLIAHFRKRSSYASHGINLITAVIVTGVGAWIFLNPQDFASIIPTALGYLVVISGIVNLLETFSLSRAHYRKWWVSLLAAIVTIFMGMLLVNHAFGIVSSMVRLGGVFLLFNGISDLWINRRVDEYVHYDNKTPGKNRKRASGSGPARHDTSSPDIIDAEDYREIDK